MLERFRQAKKAEIAALLRAQENGLLPAPKNSRRPDFASAIHSRKGISVIAEYKRASPSKGRIRSDLDVEDVARQYQAAGATAMSILTEESFFDGKLAYLEQAANVTNGAVPLLRKDFIFDPIQIDATATTPAAALLLIARFYASASELRELREHAESFGIAAVVEVFAADDLAMARDSGARIIQVNARDLDKLIVDRAACLELIRKNRPAKGEIWIAASGISKPEHLQEAEEIGFHAALVGSSLMESGQPGENLAALLKGAHA